MTSPRPLRVLHIVEASFAGVGRHVLDLAQGCAAAGDQVDIAYGTRRAEPAFLDRLPTVGARRTVAVDAGRAAGVGDLAAVRVLNRVIRDAGPYDIVHGHASKGGVYARIGRARGAARVYTPNALVTQAPDLGGPARLVYRAVEVALSRRTDGLVHVSPEERDHAAAIGLRPRRSTVIANGIECGALPSRAEARRALGVPTDATVIGFVGRLSAQKGVDRLLDALAEMAEMAETTGGGDVVLAVVGVGEDADALEQQAGALGVADRVMWLGRRPGREAMPAFDVLAVPSRYEGLPYVVLEGLWAGVPVVATTTSGAGQLLSDGAAGVLVDGSPSSLAHALTDLLGDDGRRAAMAAACRGTVAPYSLDAMVQSTRAFYRDVLGDAGA